MNNEFENIGDHVWYNTFNPMHNNIYDTNKNLYYLLRSEMEQRVADRVWHQAYLHVEDQVWGEYEESNG